DLLQHHHVVPGGPVQDRLGAQGVLHLERLDVLEGDRVEGGDGDRPLGQVRPLVLDGGRLELGVDRQGVAGGGRQGRVAAVHADLRVRRRGDVERVRPGAAGDRRVPGGGQERPRDGGRVPDRAAVGDGQGDGRPGRDRGVDGQVV